MCAEAHRRSSSHAGLTLTLTRTLNQVQTVDLACNVCEVLSLIATSRPSLLAERPLAVRLIVRALSAHCENSAEMTGSACWALRAICLVPTKGNDRARAAPAARLTEELKMAGGAQIIASALEAHREMLTRPVRSCCQELLDVLQQMKP